MKRETLVKTKSLSSEYARLARKAAYWQDSYDEWKKYGAIYTPLKLSKLISDELLQNYMDQGWNNMTNIYKKNILKNNSNKLEKKDSFESYPIEEQELTLEILGSIRKYIVKKIFIILNLSK